MITFMVRQIEENNITSETVNEYWQRSAGLTFLYIVLAEPKSHFSQKKKVHYELALIPEIFY